jgi:hypothetical protein
MGLLVRARRGDDGWGDGWGKGTNCISDALVGAGYYAYSCVCHFDDRFAMSLEDVIVFNLNLRYSDEVLKKLIVYKVCRLWWGLATRICQNVIVMGTFMCNLKMWL